MAIDKNTVIVENGEVKTILTEETQRNGMSVEEFRRLLHDSINKYAEVLTKNGHYN